MSALSLSEPCDASPEPHSATAAPSGVVAVPAASCGHAGACRGVPLALAAVERAKGGASE